jgi:NTE family protein
MWADAVFEGGGVRGVGLVGALCVAEEKGFRWKRVAGTSAGAIIAALLAAGYSGVEIYELLCKKNFSDFLNKTFLHHIPYVGPSLRVWLKKGLYSGDPLERWVEQLLAARGIRTFGDLQDRMVLHIIVSDITLANLLVLPDDLSGYGLDPKSFSVARAVRMSCSIPYFFEPVKLLHNPSGKISYIVDGGILSNFPVWIFDEEKPKWPAFGFKLLPDTDVARHEIRGPISMFRALFETMMDAHDKRAVRHQDQLRTIQVPIKGVRMTDFDLDDAKQEEMFNSGVHAAQAFFHTWSFEKYLEATGKKSDNVQISIRKSKIE